MIRLPSKRSLVVALAGLALLTQGCAAEFPIGAQQSRGAALGDACGGAEGVSCGADAFCQLAAGAACSGGAGICTTRPQTCPASNAPVCGCDGKTYANACAAQLAGASSASTSAGACSADARCVDASVASVRVAKVTLGAVPGCVPSQRTVTYERSTGVMAWPACDASATGGTSYAEVRRTLSAVEAKRVEDALAALTYVEHPTCGGYDGLEYFMDTTATSGAIVQYSAFDINCYGYRQAAGLPALYALFEELKG